LSKDGKFAIYDNPEYSDFTSHILYVTSGKPNPKSDDLEFRTRFYRRVVSEITKITVPYVKTQTEQELLFFLKDRKMFRDLQILIAHVESLYDSFDFEDHDFAQFSSQTETKRVIEGIEDEIKRVKRRDDKLWLPLSLLGSKLEKLKVLFTGERLDYEKALANVESHFGKSHAWIFALLRLLDPQARVRAERIVSKHRNRTAKTSNWWITGDDNAPWYVSLKKGKNGS
jgi:hypothetical protein